MFLIPSSLLRRRSLRSNSIFQTISRCRFCLQRDCLIKKRSLSPAFRYQLKAILSLILLSSYISCSYCALFFSSNAAISQALKKRCQNMSLFQFSSSSISPMFLNRHSDYHILVVLVAENCLESAVLQQIDITIGSNTVGLSAKACGLRKPCFDPEKGFRRGSAGANGIGNGDYEPGSEILNACGLRKQSFEPG